MSSYSVTYGRNGGPQRPEALPEGFGGIGQTEMAKCAIAEDREKPAFIEVPAGVDPCEFARAFNAR